MGFHFSKRVIFVLLATTLFCNAAQAAAEQQLKADLSWTAFTCAVLARNSGDKPEYERLFALGYEAGLAFLQAVRAGTASLDGAPTGFLMVNGGPNYEFILGRAYQALEEVYSVQLDQQAQRGIRREVAAGRLFEGNNCSLIGVPPGT